MWNLKKTRIKVHKTIKLICKWFYTTFSSYSGSKQRFPSTKLFISIPTAAKHALPVRFQGFYLLWSTKHRYHGLFLPFRKKCFPHSEYRDFDFQNSFFCKKGFGLNILKKNTFSLEPGRMKTLFAKKCFFYIYFCAVLL